MTRMELSSKDEVLQVVEDFENLSSRIEEERRWWERESSWPQVFIGGSPFTRSRNTSIIVERFDRGNEKFFFVMLGPTRMDYQKSINFFKTLEQSLFDKKGD
jgi:transcriptional regulator of heat shock response